MQMMNIVSLTSLVNYREKNDCLRVFCNQHILSAGFCHVNEIFCALIEKKVDKKKGRDFDYEALASILIFFFTFKASCGCKSIAYFKSI